MDTSFIDFDSNIYLFPVCHRTSARLLESKAVTAGPGTVPGRRTSSSSKTPAVVLALHRVNSDETSYSTGQRVPQQSTSVATQLVTSSGGATRKSRHGVGSEGWDTVRRVFHRSHRGNDGWFSAVGWFHSSIVLYSQSQLCWLVKILTLCSIDQSAILSQERRLLYSVLTSQR